MRLAIYCDYPYRLREGRLTAEQPVALFLGALAAHVGRLTMTGRLDPEPADFPYAVDGVDFVALPHYSSGADPGALLRSLPRAVARFWRLLGRVDAVWVFGPTPLSLLFAGLALIRRRRLVLGVRQDLPRLFAHRYPDRPLLRLGAHLLELGFRTLARVAPVVVVGPVLAEHYRRARQLHTVYISLLRERDIAAPETIARAYDDSELRILSVGRLDPEKNPRLLADVLARAVRIDPRWRLHVCGDGPERGALAARLHELGVADRATLHGHVPIDAGLLELYRTSHVFLHVSFTEGVPQVLLEAFAMRLPVIATAVGGVPGLVGDCGVLIPPADADAAARALQTVAADAGLREALVQRALTRVRSHTLEAESTGVAAFLERTAGARPGTAATEAVPAS